MLVVRPISFVLKNGWVGWAARQCAQLVTLFVVTSLATKYRARDKIGTEGPLAVISATAAAAAAGAPHPGEGRAAAPAATAAAGPSGSSRARGAVQVVAAGAVPAALCVAALGGGWDRGACTVAFSAFLATICGDTLASELGVLAPRGCPVVLVHTLAPVDRGTDGGISALGTAASLAGGALIGAWGGGAAAMGVWGGLGSLLDSLLGAALQARRDMSVARWRRVNAAVNAAAGVAIAGTAAAAAATAPWLFTAATALVAAECLAVLLVTARSCSRARA